MGYELVGQAWDRESFVPFIENEQGHMDWVKGVTFHHTWMPDLDMRPHGLSDQHIKNMRHFYKNEKKWKAGPHLIVDDHRIMGMSLLRQPGTHARSFNRTHIGIEVLGNYDEDNPAQGRGLAAWQNATFAAATILHHLGLSYEDTNFHRDDPLSSKSCPGKLISQGWVDILMKREITALEEPEEVAPRPKFNRQLVEQSIKSMEWQLAKMKRELAKL